VFKPPSPPSTALAATFDDRLPEKLLFDLNGNLCFGAWTYAFKTAWLGGYTPRDEILDSTTPRAFL